MKLGVKERLVLIGLLPETGNYLNLKLVREVKEALSFTEKEHKLLGLEIREGGAVAWEKNILKEFTFGGVVTGLITAALTKLDKDEKLEDKHMELYRLFVAGE